MKNPQIIFPFTVCAMVLILISCSAPSRRPLLIQPSWRFSDISSPSSDSAVYSALINNRVFLTDQVLKFNNDNTFESYFPDPQLNSGGNWEMDSEETKLTLFSNGNKSTWDIEVLDETTLEMKRHDATLDADLSYRYTRR